MLGKAVTFADNSFDYDRLIVLSDEESSDPVPAPKGNAYMINVASTKNGISYGKWKHIDGFSESSVRFIQELEKEGMI